MIRNSEKTNKTLENHCSPILQC